MLNKFICPFMAIKLKCEALVFLWYFPNAVMESTERANMKTQIKLWTS